jgi:hypothetical protein
LGRGCLRGVYDCEGGFEGEDEVISEAGDDQSFGHRIAMLLYTYEDADKFVLRPRHALVVLSRSLSYAVGCSVS